MNRSKTSDLRTGSRGCDNDGPRQAAVSGCQRKVTRGCVRSRCEIQGNGGKEGGSERPQRGHSYSRGPTDRRSCAVSECAVTPIRDRARGTRTTTRRRRSWPPLSPRRRIRDKPGQPQPWPAGLSSGGRRERAPVVLQDDGRSES
jgi:hypothetical protein